MGLGELADAIGPERVVGVPVGEVSGLAYDSRQVGSGDALLRGPGRSRRRARLHRRCRRARCRGGRRRARDPRPRRARSCWCLAPATRWPMPPMPGTAVRRSSLEVIGVTGTDGKTTTCYLAVAALQAGGKRPGMIGTVAVRVGDEVRPNEDRNTTPESLELQELLAEMVEAGNDSVVMEATSHGLAQSRVRNCRFRVAHRDQRDQRAPRVPRHRWRRTGRPRRCWSRRRRSPSSTPMTPPSATSATAPATGWSPTGPMPRAHDPRHRDRGPRPTARPSPPPRPPGAARSTCSCPVPSTCTTRWRRWPWPRSRGSIPPRPPRAMGAVSGVPGRMERIDAGQPFGVVVDYAHTADSLAKMLRTLRPLTTGRLIVVFGSAGERDRVKRPAMGKVAAELADLAVVTDEDPRLEDGHAINEAIAEGARAAGARDGEQPVGHRRSAGCDRPRHRPGQGGRHDPAGRQGARGQHVLRQREALVGRARGRSPGARRGRVQAPMADLTAFYVTDRDAWNAFVEHAPHRSFPQLWEWGELREPAGWRADPLRGGGARGRAAGRRPGADPPGPAARLAPRLRAARPHRPVRRARDAPLHARGPAPPAASWRGSPPSRSTPRLTPDDPLGAALLAAPLARRRPRSSRHAPGSSTWHPTRTPSSPRCARSTGSTSTRPSATG